MKIQSKLVVRENNGYPYIYVLFEQNKCRLRINTRMRYIKGKMTKDNLYNNKMENFEALNKEIFKVKMDVDSYIKKSFNSSLTAMDVYFSQDDFKIWKRNQQEIKSNWQKNKPKFAMTLMDYYNKFLEQKNKSSMMKPISFKNYTSLKNFIGDYVTYINKALYLYNIDEELIKKFIEFAEFDLKDMNKSRKARSIAPFKTDGNLQDVTLIKRLDNFKEFCDYLNTNGDTVINVKKIFPKMTKQAKEIVYISQNEYDEVVKIMHLVVDKYERTVLDSFLFNYYVGLRFTDLANLTINNFETISEGYILTKELNKGKKWNSVAQVPIVHPLLIKIIQEYNFHFDLKYNGQYNRALHNIFERYNLLSTPISVKKTFYRKESETVKMNSKDNKKPLLKRDLITSHTNRRSLITVALTNNYSIPEVMNLTGHKNIKTLQVYANMANKELLKKNLEKRLIEIKS